MALAKRRLPKGPQRAARSAWSSALDAVDSLLGRRDDLTPPRRLMFVGGGEYHAIGGEFIAYFRELGGLEPDHHVLDVGCGVGRMAVPLLGYQSERGSCDGFDIVPRAIQWCTESITVRRPTFRFQLADIRNPKYNPAGVVDAAEYEFPYPDASFDFVFLTSVFTHLRPEEVANYLSEISRVLRPGGRCLITYLLLNEESSRLIEEGRSRLDFPGAVGVARVFDPDLPEATIAYPEDWVRDLYHRCGLTIDEPMRFGSWCGRERDYSYQDIVIARRQP